MPAKPLTPEQIEDAQRLKSFFKSWQSTMRDLRSPVSQEAAAAKLGFGQSALSQYLNGVIPLNADALTKFAELMAVRPESISPTIATAAIERSVNWLGAESLLQEMAAAAFGRFGIAVEYARALAPHGQGMPDWLLHAAGGNTKFFPDLQLKLPDGAVAWASVKGPRAAFKIEFLERLATEHPREFAYLVGDAMEIQTKIAHWLTQRDTTSSPSAQQVTEPEPEYRQQMRNRRPVWVVGQTQGGMTERIWTDGDYPVGELEEWADVSTTDEHAFACRVVGDSMVPRYMPGEYALVEPNTVPELEDDVLVRLTTGQTMLKRLLSRRGGVRLGSYNSAEVINLREDEVSWMYYVAHPIPSRRIRQRVDMDAQQEIDRRVTNEPVTVEQRDSATRLGDDARHRVNMRKARS